MRSSVTSVCPTLIEHFARLRTITHRPDQRQGRASAKAYHGVRLMVAKCCASCHRLRAVGLPNASNTATFEPAARTPGAKRVLDRSLPVAGGDDHRRAMAAPLRF